MPQLDNVFPTLTVSENLSVGAQAIRRGDRNDAVAAVVELFPLLRDRRRQRADTLSGGQRKLLALGRALVGRPSLLLLDEPSAGLSPQAMDMVFSELEGIRDQGIGIVMVEQNARRALALSSRGYVLDMMLIPLSPTYANQRLSGDQAGEEPALVSRGLDGPRASSTVT